MNLLDTMIIKALSDNERHLLKQTPLNKPAKEMDVGAKSTIRQGVVPKRATLRWEVGKRLSNCTEKESFLRDWSVCGLLCGTTTTQSYERLFHFKRAIKKLN